MLRPELQDLGIFVDGLDNILSTQKRIAQLYFNDHSIELACPPLRALLHIMLYDHYEGWSHYAEEATRLGISARLASAQKTSEAVRSTDYVQRLRGTIGAQPW